MTDAPPAPAFRTIARLYKRHTRSGKTIYFGRDADGRRLYLFEVEGRRPKDAKPFFNLCIRAEDAKKGNNT